MCVFIYYCHFLKLDISLRCPGREEWLCLGRKVKKEHLKKLRGRKEVFEVWAIWQKQHPHRWRPRTRPVTVGGNEAFEAEFVLQNVLQYALLFMDWIPSLCVHACRNICLNTISILCQGWFGFILEKCRHKGNTLLWEMVTWVRRVHQKQRCEWKKTLGPQSPES